MLIESNFSLRAANRSKIDFYRRNAHLLLNALSRHFPPVSRVTWNVPAGGFFAVVNVPLTADEKLLEVSAAQTVCCGPR